MSNKTYSEKLLDPRWQKKRLFIFNRDSFCCQRCFSESVTLHVHHLKYEKGKEPWEIDDNFLVTLCKDCHEYEEDNYKINLENMIHFIQSKRMLSDELFTMIELLYNLEDLGSYTISCIGYNTSNHLKEMSEKFEAALPIYSKLHNERLNSINKLKAKK